MSHLTITISGANAPQTAQALQAVLQQEFQQTTQLETPAASTDVHRGIDPISLATLILTIPTYLLAALQLSDRLKQVDKIKRLQEALDKTTPARLEDKQGHSIDLTQSTPAEIIDFATERAKRLNNTTDKDE